MDYCKTYSLPGALPVSCSTMCSVCRKSEKKITCRRGCLIMDNVYTSDTFNQNKIITCCCFEKGHNEIFNNGSQNFSNCCCFSKYNGSNDKATYSMINCCCCSKVKTEGEYTGKGYYLCGLGCLLTDTITAIRYCCCEYITTS